MKAEADAIFKTALETDIIRCWDWQACLDLHQLTVNESKIAIRFILQEIAKNSRSVPPQALTIITGTGDMLTSKDPSYQPSLRPMLLEHLQKEHHLKAQETGAGEFVVAMAEIRKWIAAYEAKETAKAQESGQDNLNL